MDHESTGRPCWPFVWLWILSIAQYSYRYILQVNDPRTTDRYAATPPVLSAIKYAILLLFLSYAAFQFLRKPLRTTTHYRSVAQITGFGILALLAILLFRIAVIPGDLEETSLCAAQLLPWMASALLVPFLVNEKQSIASTFSHFERIAFWVTFLFWLTTVGLAAAGIRYPALSYPGVLLRFGGILDDPNGYACLCLLLMTIAFGMRRGAWLLRTIVYGLMIAGTLSLSGYVTAGLVCGFLVLLKAYRTKKGIARWLLLGCFASSAVFVALIALPAVYNIHHALNALGQVYTSKGSSAATHFSDLLPPENTLQSYSLAGILFGTGGFSENLYWRILANFGVVGLLVVIGLAVLWLCSGARLHERWRRSWLAWNIGVLAGSNGIAYLLTFPLSLIFWSGLALVLCERQPPAVDSPNR